MRPDMYQVLTERPRWNPGPRKRGQANLPDELLPKFEGILRPHFRHKSSRCLRGPLRRWLHSQLGRPWNDVYSEACAVLKPGGGGRGNGRAWLLQFVECKTLIRDGSVCVIARCRGQERIVPVEEFRSRWNLFYVHPETFLLCEIPKRPKTRWRDEAAEHRRLTQRRINRTTLLRQVNGNWFECHVERFPEICQKGDSPWRFDAAEKKLICRSKALKIYGREVYCTAKRQLSRRELRRFQVSNSPHGEARSSAGFQTGRLTTALHSSIRVDRPFLIVPPAATRHARNDMRRQIAMLALCIAGFLSDAILAADDYYLVPGANLVVEGVPKIPAQLAEDVSRYMEVRPAGFAGWHPVRREMLITTRFADTAQIHLVKFPGGARTQLTFFKDRVTGASYQPTKGDYFVFGKDSGGDENYQLYRYDFATGTITRLTDGKSRNTGGLWSNAGDQYVYGSTRRNGKDVDLWVMNPSDSKSNRLLAQLEGGGWDARDFFPNDRQLLLGEYVSANESALWLLDLATGGRTLITPKGGPEKISYENARFSKDGKGIYVTTDRDSEFHRLAYIDLATGRHTYLTDHIKWDVDDIALSWDGRTLAFGANEDGLGILHLLDTGSGKERAVAKMPPGETFPTAWHKNNRDLGFTYTSARNPQDCYSLDVETGKVDRWTTGETGGLNAEDFAEPEVVRWKSFDERMISGLYYKPPARFTGKRPVIIEIHGGPEEQSRPDFQANDNYFINELGVALIEPNVRGSSGYGKTFLQLDNGFLREGSYRDIGALLDWIITRPDLDADRVMVTGGSYGGHMTLAVAANYPERIRCALDYVGPSNLATFLEHTSAYRQDLRRAEYGDERDPKMREFLNRIAPLNNAAKITKPLFVVQGGNDPRVPLSESEQMVQSVRKNGTPVWYLMAKDEGHGFAKKPNREFLLCAKVLFVKEYLLN